MKIVDALAEPALIDGRDSGRWSLVTSSGARYILDLDARTSTRFANDPGWHDGSAFEQALLRRDGEALALLGFDPIRIGCRAVVHLAEVDDYAGYDSTFRELTPVLSVERIEPPLVTLMCRRTDGVADPVGEVVTHAACGHSVLLQPADIAILNDPTSFGHVDAVIEVWCVRCVIEEDLVSGRLCV